MIPTSSRRHAPRAWLLTAAISVVFLVSAVALIRVAGAFTVAFGLALAFWGVSGLLSLGSEQ